MQQEAEESRTRMMTMSGEEMTSQEQPADMTIHCAVLNVTTTSGVHSQCSLTGLQEAFCK